VPPSADPDQRIDEHREKMPNGFRWRLMGFASREIELAP
jgi:hypothetical protein